MTDLVLLSQHFIVEGLMGGETWAFLQDVFDGISLLFVDEINQIKSL